MTIDVYWGSGSPYSWRVLLALEHKGLSYNSHLLHLGMQEHKAPHMLALNPRGRVPVLKDGDYVVFESLAVLYYLDRKYPAKPLFGDSPEEGAVIMRVCCEYQAYIEPYVTRITRATATGCRGRSCSRRHRACRRRSTGLSTTVLRWCAPRPRSCASRRYSHRNMDHPGD